MQDGRCRNLGRFKIHLTEADSRVPNHLGIFGGKYYACTFGAVAVLPQVALRSHNRCCNRPRHFSFWVVHWQTTKHKANVVLNLWGNLDESLTLHQFERLLGLLLLIREVRRASSIANSAYPQKCAKGLQA